jgi:hypothetical protein
MQKNLTFKKFIFEKFYYTDAQLSNSNSFFLYTPWLFGTHSSFFDKSMDYDTCDKTKFKLQAFFISNLERTTTQKKY